MAFKGFASNLWFKLQLNIGAIILRIGFWGPLYFTQNKEPQNSIAIVF